MPTELKHTVICKRCESKGEISPLFKGIVLIGHYFNRRMDGNPNVSLARCVKCLSCGYSYVSKKVFH